MVVNKVFVCDIIEIEGEEFRVINEGFLIV